MTVSVVIPTYNSGQLVTEAIESILAQTSPVHEILVVDDGSTDDTLVRMSQFGPPVRYIKKENGGVSSARNRGVQEAKGEWIAFLDADDVWNPKKLELQLKALNSRPELGLLGTLMYSWPGSHPAIEVARPDDRIRVIGLDDLLVKNFLATSTIIARANVLRSVGLFDQSLQGPEDYDLWIRIAQAYPVANLGIPLIGYRHSHPGSLSKNVARMERDMRTILEKLEARGLFKGRLILRRKAWGFYWYACSVMRYLASNPGYSMRHSIRSFLTYPMPYSRRIVTKRFGRMGVFMAAFLCWTGIKKRHEIYSGDS
jgi:glycosyltransferase involved in cell wall biosynthesis